jgi:hypothetical protein
LGLVLDCLVAFPFIRSASDIRHNKHHHLHNIFMTGLYLP